jgi:uncharacterized protein YgbK (DUF1537 family)
MRGLVYAAVADDDTGATDLAGMLAESGASPLLLIDLPPADCAEEWLRDSDVAVIGAGTRARTPAEAYDITRQAVRLLGAWSPRVLQIKYCSTFDSTPEGNIGPSLDAAMDESGEAFTVALPALPVNGRTTYMGHHFVHQQLLSDSPMRNHPLTPMRDSNLVTHLQKQTARRVGLAKYPVSRAALDELRGAGVEIAVLDCISDADLAGVCEAIADLRLISGSSAPAMKLPGIWARRGWFAPAERPLRAPGAGGRGVLIAAGSCSAATRGQNEWFEAQGGCSVVLDPVLLAAGSGDREACRTAVRELEAGRPCLLRTSSSVQDRERVEQWGRDHSMSVNETGLAIAYGMARLAREVAETRPPAGLIVAGGETSSAICRVLEMGALRVGRNIEPGVPLCVSLGRFRAPVVLKSGNFGSVDFYGRAVAACAALP